MILRRCRLKLHSQILHNLCFSSGYYSRTREIENSAYGIFFFFLWVLGGAKKLHYGPWEMCKWRIGKFRIPGQPRMSACFRAKARLIWVNFWRITNKHLFISLIVRPDLPTVLLCETDLPTGKVWALKSFHFHDFYRFPVTQPLLLVFSPRSWPAIASHSC